MVMQPQTITLPPPNLPVGTTCWAVRGAPGLFQTHCLPSDTKQLILVSSDQITQVVLLQFSPEPRFEPEPCWTGPKVQFRFGASPELDQKSSSGFGGWLNYKNQFEPVRTILLQCGWWASLPVCRHDILSTLIHIMTKELDKLCHSLGSVSWLFVIWLDEWVVIYYILLP